MIFAAKDFNVYHLGMIPVNYPPRSINTYAIQVTSENIGALSLELQVGLRYDGDGVPYVKFAAERGTVEQPDTPDGLHVYVDDWIVVLWDQLYVFQDTEFRNTFHHSVAEPTLRHEPAGGVQVSVRGSLSDLERRADEALRFEQKIDAAQGRPALDDSFTASEDR
jgi:hypothetical protein